MSASKRNIGPSPRHILAPARSDTNDTTLSRDDYSHRSYIIFVNGFDGPKQTKARHAEFEHWRQQANRGGLFPAKVKMIKTDLVGILKGAEISLGWNKLFRFLGKLMTPKTGGRPGSSESHHKFSSEVNRNTDGQYVSEPTFILIAHGLGSWVVRDFINKQRDTPMVINITGAIFLEVPDYHQLGNEGKYVDYLKTVQETFKLNPEIPPGLASILLGIDKTFFENTLGFIKKITGRSLQIQNIWNGHLKSMTGVNENLTPARSKVRRSIKEMTERLNGRKRISNQRGGDQFSELNTTINELQSDANDDIGTSPQVIGVSSWIASNPPLRSSLSLPLPSSGDVGIPNLNTISETSRPILSHSDLGNESLVQRDLKESPVQTESQDLEALLDFAETCLTNGEFELAKGRFQEAEELLSQKVEDMQGDPKRNLTCERILKVRVRKLLAYTYLKDVAGYNTVLKSLGHLVTESTDDDTKDEARRLRGFTLILRGDFEKAEEELQKLQIAWGSQLRSDEVAILTSRDLAHVYALLGKFDKCGESLKITRETLTRKNKAKSVNSQPNPDDPKSLLLEATNDRITLTEATVSLLFGNYREGLDKAQTACDGMHRHLGKNHLETLGSMKLKAFLLALNSKSLEAENICKDALKSMNVVLGNGHPLTLDAMCVLMFIFRTQARLVEAVSMGKSVCSKMEIHLTESHPQTMNAKAELAANYRSIGDYYLAAGILKNIIDRCQSRYSWTNPSTTRYLSELAHVYYCSGFFPAAEELASAVLKKQREIYIRGRSDGTAAESRLQETHTVSVALESHRSHSVIKQILNDIDYEFKLLKERQNKPTQLDEEITGIPNSRLRVHPDLLYTLQVLVTVLSQKPQTEEEEKLNEPLVQEILYLIWKWKSETLGPSNASTLTSEYELADAYRRKRALDKARSHFQNVYISRLRLLRREHSDTLSAKRELIITNYADGIWQDPESLLKNTGPTNSKKLTLEDNYDKVESQSKFILMVQEERMGKRHPSSLKTLMWIFLVQLDSKDKVSRAVATANTILERLRDPSVKEQRYLEASEMEKRIAYFYEEYGRKELAKKVRQHFIAPSEAAESAQNDAKIDTKSYVQALENDGGRKAMGLETAGQSIG